MEAAGVLNLCAGQEAGIQAAIHAMIRLVDDESTDAILLIHADNAFNRLNRRCPPQNRFICPKLSIALINCYRRPARLFVFGGEEFSSSEGTTQGHTGHGDVRAWNSATYSQIAR